MTHTIEIEIIQNFFKSQKLKPEYIKQAIIRDKKYSGCEYLIKNNLTPVKIGTVCKISGKVFV